jgi:transposase
MSPKSQGEVSSNLGFYGKLDRQLTAMDFARQVSELCEPLYWEERLEGRPGIDPVVYFKMLLIGFLENLHSEQAIAARCEDSLSLRAFLGYGLEERPPDHASLSVAPQRLGPQICQKASELGLLALKAHGLLNGESIDAKVIEANANLRSLINRNTEHLYREYVKELTRQPDIRLENTKLVTLYDKKQNQERDIVTVAKETSVYEYHEPENAENAHQARWCRSLWRRNRAKNSVS